MFNSIISGMLYLAAMTLVWIALALFFVLNLSSIAKVFTETKSKYFLEMSSFINQLQYFTFTDINVKNLRYISAVLFGVIGLAISTAFDLGVVVLLLSIIIGYLAPNLIIKSYRNKYLNSIDAQLIPALNALANSMQAGLNLPQAIAETANAIPSPMSREFIIITRQLKLGMTVEQALGSFNQRIPLADINLAAKAMAISMKMGTNLPTALNKISETIGNRKRIKSKIDVITAQGKAQGIVVGVLPIALGAVLFILDPSYIQVLTTTFIGKLLLVAMVVMETVAFFVIKRIITIDI
ncbi:MAG: type II secretion system F family protein [Candidatus Omnitrophica bacterium]|nr:type II secretion system F family protein [Candidatus Omnitrophota bacterium]